MVTTDLSNVALGISKQRAIFPTSFVCKRWKCHFSLWPLYMEQFFFFWKDMWNNTVYAKHFLQMRKHWKYCLFYRYCHFFYKLHVQILAYFIYPDILRRDSNMQTAVETLLTKISGEVSTPKIKNNIIWADRVTVQYLSFLFRTRKTWVEIMTGPFDFVWSGGHLEFWSISCFSQTCHSGPGGRASWNLLQKLPKVTLLCQCHSVLKLLTL